MLVLLPPSEGKFAPVRGRPLDLSTLSFPELSSTRALVLDALVGLCRGDAERARSTLDLPPGLAAEVTRNAGLPHAPTVEARRIYTGVLYDALGIGTLTPSAKRRASSRVLVTSALFGVLRLSDRIPAYRLSGDASLPGIGTVASAWRAGLDPVLGRLAARQLVIDLRSGQYAGFWRPGKELALRVVSVRVLLESGGSRTVVSHVNKATKGRLVRSLLEDGADPGSATALVSTLTRLGWRVEPTPGRPHSYDVIVTHL